MKVLIFDTETTGLPKSRKSALLEPNIWPHIVSIAWTILDVDTNKIITKKSFLVRPGDWNVPLESTKIHGITHEKAERDGVPLADVMEEFLEERYDTIIAHNLEFDWNVLMNALRWDLGRDTPLTVPGKCTMKLGADLCKLPSKFGSMYKPPKLRELYQFAFQRSPVEASLHSALYDTLILTEIVQYCDPLRERIGLPVKSLSKQNGVGSNVLYINFS